MVNVAREAMMAIGCIQAQRCHTGHCPAGIATQNRWLMRGLNPTLKSARLANYFVNLRKELLRLSYVCGVSHPSQVTLDQFEILNDQLNSHSAQHLLGYAKFDATDVARPRESTSEPSRLTIVELTSGGAASTWPVDESLIHSVNSSTP